MYEPWLNLGVALALGLLLGFERERAKGNGPARSTAGIRTFGLASMLGALAMILGGYQLLGVIVLAITAFAVVGYCKA